MTSNGDIKKHHKQQQQQQLHVYQKKEQHNHHSHNNNYKHEREHESGPHGSGHDGHSSSHSILNGENVKLHMLSVPFRFSLFGLKFWNKKSLSINEYDSVHKVIYLGNVLTPIAKGDACVEKPLATLWNNYCANVKHDIDMKLTICNSGLKALTKEHGLTEYWANRITYCCAHEAHPKVFCWVYRHDGRKMKPELRCHAVLCSSKDKAARMASLLTTKLTVALQDFRREKKIRQNARLSFVEIPMRKQLLVKGLANFRAPLERSKSAPKLTSILEENKDEDEVSETGSAISELIEEYESMKM